MKTTYRPKPPVRVGIRRSLRRRWHRGFTLIELIMAFSIASVVIVAVLQNVVGGVAARGRAAQLDLAVQLAKGKMLEMEATPESYSKETKEREAIEEHPGFFYSQEVVEEEINLGEKTADAVEDAKQTAIAEGDTAKQASIETNIDEILAGNPFFESATFSTFKFQRLTVIIYYNDGKREREYKLETYKMPEALF